MGKAAVILSPALLEKKAIFWVSPIRALRDDCADGFTKLGAIAMALKDLSRGDIENVRIVLVSPEDLLVEIT